MESSDLAPCLISWHSTATGIQIKRQQFWWLISSWSTHERQVQERRGGRRIPWFITSQSLKPLAMAMAINGPPFGFTKNLVRPPHCVELSLTPMKKKIWLCFGTCILLHTKHLNEFWAKACRLCLIYWMVHSWFGSLAKPSKTLSFWSPTELFSCWYVCMNWFCVFVQHKGTAINVPLS